MAKCQTRKTEGQPQALSRQLRSLFLMVMRPSSSSSGATGWPWGDPRSVRLVRGPSITKETGRWRAQRLMITWPEWPRTDQDLYLPADGGAVHFVGSHNEARCGRGKRGWLYQASEVFDPHGLRTALTYDERRPSHHMWNKRASLADPHCLEWPFVVIPGDGHWKSDRYWRCRVAARCYKSRRYRQFREGRFYVLAKVTYADTPAPGQAASAFYYGHWPTKGTTKREGPQTVSPILKEADDPHFCRGDDQNLSTITSARLLSPPGPSPIRPRLWL